MSRIRLMLSISVLTVIAVLGLAAPSSARALGVCGPRDDPATCTAAFQPNQQLAIKPGIPFVWLRNDASSSAPVNATVNYSPNARFVMEYWPSAYDGYQNWWLVHLVSDKSKAGLVEQASLIDGGIPTGTKAPWNTPFIGSVRAGVPFIWVRANPFSNATVVATIRPSEPFTVLVDPAPVHDGIQWWWYVSTNSAAGTKQGYVEQASIVRVRPIPATSVTPTAPPTTPPDAPPHMYWTNAFAGAIKPGVPFVYVRNAPASTAGVLFTLHPGNPFTILANNAPVYDGRQWWWKVSAPVITLPKDGWVEEASLVEYVDASPVTTGSSPTCGSMTVSPATYTPSEAGVAAYYVTSGSDITLSVDGLSNLASITIINPGSNATVWRNGFESRKFDLPPEKVEIHLTVPQDYGWASVSAEAVGLNGETIKCGAFWLENRPGSDSAATTPEALDAPAVTPEPSS